LALESDRVKRLEDDIRKREVILSNTELQVDQQVQMKLNKSVCQDYFYVKYLFVLDYDMKLNNNLQNEIKIYN